MPRPLGGGGLGLGFIDEGLDPELQQLRDRQDAMRSLEAQRAAEAAAAQAKFEQEAARRAQLRSYGAPDTAVPLRPSPSATGGTAPTTTAGTQTTNASPPTRDFELDAAWRAYQANPEAYDRDRSTVPSELRYDLGDGSGAHSYNAGLHKTEGGMGPAAFGGDRVFGQERSTPTSDAGPVARSGGGVSSPGGTDDEAYQRYRHNLLGDSDYAAERAGIAESGAREARAAALTEDPFAQELRAFQLEALKTQLGIGRDRARLQSEHDVKLGPLLAQAKAEHEQGVATIGSATGYTPQQKAAAMKEVDSAYAQAIARINALAARPPSQGESFAAQTPGA